MKILLDTNVVLDILLDREPFRDDSLNAMKSALEKGHLLYLSASAVTDVFYVLRKATRSKQETLIHLRTLLKIVSIASANEKIILNAVGSQISDFEDAVVDETASYNDIDLILTRNSKDFRKANTKVMTPAEYLKSDNVRP